MRTAFTLIEMLAAAALTALLFVTALVISTGQYRQLRGATDTAMPRNMTEMIRRDLVNSRQFSNVPHGIKIHGFAAIDPHTLAPTCPGPTQIVYEVEQMDGQSWLIRRQSHAGETFSDLVCPRVLGLTVEQSSQSDGAAVKPPTTQPVLPVVVRLTVRWTGPGRPAWDQLLALR